MTSRNLELVIGRLRAAQERVQRAAAVKAARAATARARASLEEARALLEPAAPVNAAETARVIDELAKAEAVPVDADRWGLVREELALRSAGTPSHLIAHGLIRLGICEGKGTAADVKACMAWVRKERQRWRDRG